MKIILGYLTCLEKKKKIAGVYLLTAVVPLSKPSLLQPVSCREGTATGNKVATCRTLFNAPVNIDRGSDNINSDGPQNDMLLAAFVRGQIEARNCCRPIIISVW